MAKKYFPDEDPIGKQILYAPMDTQPPMEIVGIVDDIKEGPLDRETWPTMYVAFNQDPTNNFSIVVRTAQAEQSLLPTLAATIHRIDPGISTFFEGTMTAKINDSPAAILHRSSAWLVGAFAAVAFLLSVVGLYGVVAYSVSQRTREIGIRIALGAQRGSVYQLILKEAGWLIALGITAGLVCSVAAATLMRNLLFGVRSWDLPTLAAVAAVLAVAALLASYIPARRAASLDPVEVLRAE
jgi:macrolide transport system ATP-binding/permease protein